MGDFYLFIFFDKTDPGTFFETRNLEIALYKTILKVGLKVKQVKNTSVCAHEIVPESR